MSLRHQLDFYCEMNKDVPMLIVGDFVTPKDEPELEYIDRKDFPKKVMKIEKGPSYAGGYFVFFDLLKVDGMYINCLKKV